MKKTPDRNRDPIKLLSQKLYDGLLGASGREELFDDGTATDNPLAMAYQFDRTLDRAATIVARACGTGEIGVHQGRPSHLSVVSPPVAKEGNPSDREVCKPLDPFNEATQGGSATRTKSGRVIVRDTPAFASEAAEYITRRRVHPREFVEHIDRLVRTEGFQVVDEAIYGLRAAALHAPDGSEETLLAIDHHGKGHRRIVILVSILNERMDQLVWQSKSPNCKMRLNIAIATLIARSRDGELLPKLSDTA